MLYLITFIIFILFSIFIIRLLIIKNNLDKLENNIKKWFNERTNIIPAIFEITKNSFSKHDEVFKEILKYRKEELYKYYIKESDDNVENEFIKLIHMNKLIHHELNFIFKVSNKHPKLAKKWNFIYLRDLIISKNYNIADILNKYKRKLKVYNKLISLKNLTIIWILIPISKKSMVWKI